MLAGAVDAKIIDIYLMLAKRIGIAPNKKLNSAIVEALGGVDDAAAERIGQTIPPDATMDDGGSSFTGTPRRRSLA